MTFRPIPLRRISSADSIEHMFLAAGGGDNENGQQSHPDPVADLRSATSPSSADSALGAARDALRGLNAVDLDDVALSKLMSELEVLRNILDSAQAQAAAVWDARAVWGTDGARSGAAWLAANTSASRPAAASMLKLARSLRSMPRSAAALAAGDIGVAQARILAAARSEAPDVFAQHEDMLVEQAKSLRADEFSRAASFWIAHANPDGQRDRDAERYVSRHVRLSAGFGGMWSLDGHLTADLGEALRDALDCIARRMYRSDKALAEANADAGLMRSAGQRRHDALEELARAQRSSADGGEAVNVPSITAVVHVEALAEIHGDAGDPVGESAGGAMITRARAERHLCDCSLSRVVMGPDSVPIDLGGASRLASPAQRRALAVAYRGCAFPGCDCPPGWTSAHHVVHWVHGGPTDLDNLIPLCSFHHHCVHEGGFTVRREHPGQLAFSRPDGTALEVPRGRAPDPGRASPPRSVGGG